MDKPTFDIEDFIAQADARLQESIDGLNRLSTQLRNAFQTKPALVLGSVMVAGFVSGLLLRKGKLSLQGARDKISADPIILFFTGAVAGFTVGPRIMDDLNSQHGMAQRGGINRDDVTGTSLRPASMEGLTRR